MIQTFKCRYDTLYALIFLDVFVVCRNLQRSCLHVSMRSFLLERNLSLFRILFCLLYLLVYAVIFLLCVV